MLVLDPAARRRVPAAFSAWYLASLFRESGWLPRWHQPRDVSPQRGCVRGKGGKSWKLSLCRSNIGFGFDLGILGFQAARWYSLIRPPRTGFRRIWRVLRSAGMMPGTGPGSEMRWPRP
jgi:hypothetical protein